MVKNNNDINLEQVEEPHFGVQKTNQAEVDESEQDNDLLVFDKSISISKNKFEILDNTEMPHEEMSMALNFEDIDNLRDERIAAQ